MNLQRLKHRHDARTVHRIRQRQAWEDGYSRARSEPDYWPDDDWGDYACTRCGGEGFCQVDDPLWDDCDEFGEGPCNACRGTGLRSRQTVF